MEPTIPFLRVKLYPTFHNYTNHSLSLSLSLSLSFSLSPVNEHDYTALNEFLTFEPSEAPEQSVCHPVVVHDDREVEGAEFFLLRLTSSDPVVILEPASATVTITEGDGKFVCL